MINKKYLPSKRFVAALAIAVVIILITVILNSIKPSVPKYNDSNLIVSNASSSASEIDSDGDGLPDWEEALYGTDPHNPDTDGDGTPDGEEIKEGRDPLKANTALKGQKPNDYMDPSVIAESNAVSNADQGLNATEKMAHDLVSDIIASQPVNGDMDPDTVNTLVQQSISDIPQKQFSGTTTAADLDLIPIDQSSSQAQITAYINNFSAATKPLEKVLGEDIVIVNDSFSSGAALDQKAMKSVIAQYQTVINSLIKMPLPAIAGSNGVIYDLKVINDLEGLVAIDNDIINSGDDTVNVYADLTAYSGVMSDLTSSLSTIDANLGIQR